MHLADAVRFALELPEVTEAPHHDAHSFRVGKAIIATVPPGADFLHVMLSEDEAEEALSGKALGLERLHWGRKVAGVRVCLDAAEPDIVQDLLETAWRRRAPKRAIAAFDATND